MKKQWNKIFNFLIRLNDKSPERILYFVGIFLVVWGIVAYEISEKIIEITGVERKCFILETTGYYCPGCGGTRAFIHLIHGELIQSFFCNAFVPYSLILFIVFMILQTLNIITKGRIGEIKNKKIIPALIIVAGIILIIQWLIKIILIVGWNYFVL